MHIFGLGAIFALQQIHDRNLKMEGQIFFTYFLCARKQLTNIIIEALFSDG